MLYHVHMVVDVPHDLPAEQAEDIRRREKAYVLDLQQKGVWLHLWRVVGEVANFSIIDVPTHDDLHDLLTKLPLFPFMTIKVTPLAVHPSALAATALHRTA